MIDIKKFVSSIKGHHKIGPVGFQDGHELVTSKCLAMLEFLNASILCSYASLFHYCILHFRRKHK